MGIKTQKNPYIPQNYFHLREKKLPRKQSEFQKVYGSMGRKASYIFIIF